MKYIFNLWCMPEDFVVSRSFPYKHMLVVVLQVYTDRFIWGWNISFIGTIREFHISFCPCCTCTWAQQITHAEFIAGLQSIFRSFKAFFIGHSQGWSSNVSFVFPHHSWFSGVLHILSNIGSDNYARKESSSHSLFNT